VGVRETDEGNFGWYNSYKSKQRRLIRFHGVTKHLHGVYSRKEERRLGIWIGVLHHPPLGFFVNLITTRHLLFLFIASFPFLESCLPPPLFCFYENFVLNLNAIKKFFGGIDWSKCKFWLGICSKPNLLFRGEGFDLRKYSIEGKHNNRRRGTEESGRREKILILSFNSQWRRQHCGAS